MPRTVEEILANADALAARFEQYEPRPEDELDARSLAALTDAVQEQSTAERHMVDAIRIAREEGVPWAVIGDRIGTSGEAARQRYSRLVA